MNFKKNILEILSTKTLQHSLVTISGTVINGVLGLFFYILLARNLGPANFGIFTVAVISLTLLADIGSFGVDTSVIRFLGKYGAEEKSRSFLKLALKIKFLVWLVILGVGWILAPTIAQTFFQKSSLIFPLQLAFLGVGGAMLFSLISSALQGYQRYQNWAQLNISINLLRLMLLILGVSLTILTVNNALYIFIVTPFLGFLIGSTLLSNFISAPLNKNILSEFFTFNKWIAILTVIAAISARLDIYLLTRFSSIKEVGYYGVATQLASVLPQLIFALAAVAAPKLASFDNKGKAVSYLKKLSLLTGGLSVVGLILLPVINFMIPLIFGSSYYNSIAPFSILFLAQLIFLISLPAHQAIFYFFAQPKIFVGVTLINILTMIFVGLWLVPIYGPIGAAVTLLIGNLVNFILPTIWVIGQFSQKIK
ncbi:MAG: oligosaccharide flippase family protein [Candidatus Daviesbacteria bacterium]|nr:oligosaccharide flippase family protein [Candidatus Daviesbacteria bacterium]